MLHIINKSPFQHQALEQAGKFSENGDPLLLLEDAVYAAQEGTFWQPKLEALLANHTVYAMEADLKARGISRVANGIEVIDYGGFVDLSVEHKVQSWM